MSAKNYSTKMKATIQRSGKLGFNSAAIEKIHISVGTYVKFAEDAESNLYLIFLSEVNEDAFKVCKAGAYYYVNSRGIFDALNYNFQNKSVVFDMCETNDDYGKVIYKLIERVVDEQKKQE